MSDPLTCGVRTVTASDGTDLPVPVGGLGLPDGGSVDIAEGAQVQTIVNYDGQGNVIGYYVAINNDTDSESEASKLFEEVSVEGAITQLEHMATEAFSEIAPFAFKAAGLTLGVLVSVFTSSHLTREVYIRTTLDTGNNTDGPPITYCLLLPDA